MSRAPRWRFFDGQVFTLVKSESGPRPAGPHTKETTTGFIAVRLKDAAQRFQDPRCQTPCLRLLPFTTTATAVRRMIGNCVPLHKRMCLSAEGGGDVLPGYRLIVFVCRRMKNPRICVVSIRNRASNRPRRTGQLRLYPGPDSRPIDDFQVVSSHRQDYDAGVSMECPGNASTHCLDPLAESAPRRRLSRALASDPEGDDSASRFIHGRSGRSNSSTNAHPTAELPRSRRVLLTAKDSLNLLQPPPG